VQSASLGGESGAQERGGIAVSGAASDAGGDAAGENPHAGGHALDLTEPRMPTDGHRSANQPEAAQPAPVQRRQLEPEFGRSGAGTGRTGWFGWRWLRPALG
jgi:hypothetical protein